MYYVVMGIQYPLTPLLITERVWYRGMNPAHILQHRGGIQQHNLDSQNLCLTKTGCNSSARLCPLKILFYDSRPHLETTKLQGP